MGIFGGEKYSKEKFEEDQEKERVALEVADSLYIIPASLNPELSKICNEIVEVSVKASERAEELYAKGQTEAAALNEEHGRLLAKAQEAIKAVADFEREKLGMRKKGAEEADADKK